MVGSSLACCSLICTCSVVGSSLASLQVGSSAVCRVHLRRHLRHLWVWDHGQSLVAQILPREPDIRPANHCQFATPHLLSIHAHLQLQLRVWQLQCVVRRLQRLLWRLRQLLRVWQLRRLLRVWQLRRLLRAQSSMCQSPAAAGLVDAGHCWTLRRLLPSIGGPWTLLDAASTASASLCVCGPLPPCVQSLLAECPPHQRPAHLCFHPLPQPLPPAL